MKLSLLFQKATSFFRILKSISFPDSYKELGKCDIILCCHDVNRGETLQNRAYSRLIDSITENLTKEGWVCAQFSYAPSVLVGDKAWGKPFSANRRLCGGIFLRYLNRIIKKFGLQLSKKSIFYIKTFEERFYEEIFQKTHCKCVITIGAPAAMCSVARKLNLPIIELIHGIGYATIPWNWDKQSTEFLPTGILSLDDVSTRTFSTLSSKGILVRQIDNPWLRRFIDPLQRELLPEEWKHSPTWLPKNRQIILISFQWGYAGDHGSYAHIADILPNGLIAESLLEVIESTQDSVFWLLRLHPVQLRLAKYNYQRSFLEKLVSRLSNCEWYQSSTIPLPLLLRQCHGHITMSSMTTYDAAFFGIPTLLLCPSIRPGGRDEHMFSDLKLSGFAELGQFDAYCIQKWVKNTQPRTAPFRVNSQHSLEETIKWILHANTQTVAEDSASLVL